MIRRIHRQNPESITWASERRQVSDFRAQSQPLVQQPFTAAAQAITGRLVSVSFHCEKLPRGGVFNEGDQAIPLNPDYTFENFVVGSCNQFAHAASLAVACRGVSAVISASASPASMARRRRSRALVTASSAAYGYMFVSDGLALWTPRDYRLEKQRDASLRADEIVSSMRAGAKALHAGYIQRLRLYSKGYTGTA